MGDEAHPQIGNIHDMLSEISSKLKEVDFPNLSCITMEMMKRRKQSYHEEISAMTRGFYTPAGIFVWTVENLLICANFWWKAQFLSQAYSNLYVFFRKL